MNVYDFDGTIYDGDSSVDFYLFCLKKNLMILKYIPKQLKSVLLYKLKKITKTQMKEAFFAFLKDIDLNKCLKEFWGKNERKIKDWYIKEKRTDDVIISASPEFLLKPICEKIGIKHLIGSKVNPLTGKFEDENCKGDKKVELFNKEFKDITINNFYSDSLSDEPLAKIAEHAYMVKGNEIKCWNHKKDTKIKN